MKIKLYFYHEQWARDYISKPEIVAWHLRMDDDLTGLRLRIFLCEHEVEVPDVLPLPEAEIKDIMVTGLRQEAKDLQAETHMKLVKIEEQIQQLLCIENKGGA